MTHEGDSGLPSSAYVNSPNDVAEIISAALGFWSKLADLASEGHSEFVRELLHEFIDILYSVDDSSIAAYFYIRPYILSCLSGSEAICNAFREESPACQAVGLGLTFLASAMLTCEQCKDGSTQLHYCTDPDHHGPDGSLHYRFSLIHGPCTESAKQSYLNLPLDAQRFIDAGGLRGLRNRLGIQTPLGRPCYLVGDARMSGNEHHIGFRAHFSPPILSGQSPDKGRAFSYLSEPGARTSPQSYTQGVAGKEFPVTTVSDDPDPLLSAEHDEDVQSSFASGTVVQSQSCCIF